MDIFYHVTTAEAWKLIQKEGFRGSDRVCGYGVYLFDDLELAVEYAQDVEAFGDGAQAVILKVKSDDLISCEEALGGFPEREGDQAYYEHVFLYPMADEPVWRPQYVQKLKAW